MDRTPPRRAPSRPRGLVVAACLALAALTPGSAARAQGTPYLVRDAGLSALVEDRAGFAVRADWSPAECATRASGVLRCAHPGAVATFRPVPGGPAGEQRYRFALNVGGLDVTGPLGPSLTVELRTGDQLDRAGVIEDCVARGAAIVCRP